MEQMKSAFFVHDRTFRVETVDVPALGENEVQVDIAYCGICGTDMHIFHGAMPHRLGDRRVLGHEASGIVSAIGSGVTDVVVGQPVTIRPLSHCGDCPACSAGHTHICHNLKFLGIDTDGGFSERWIVPADTVHPLPDGVSLKAAALTEPLAVACHDVSRAELTEGEDVLVIGAGPIGLLVAMVARARGARVVVSEVNKNRIAVAQRLGFDIIDPVAEDLPAAVSKRTGGKGADVVFEVSGTQAGVDAMTSVAAVRARIVMVAIHTDAPKVDMFALFWRELELLGARVYRPEDYSEAISMIARGEVDANALITDIAPLDDIQSAFEALDKSPTAMKSLIEVGLGSLA